jgi:hypothetical protein
MSRWSGIRGVCSDIVAMDVEMWKAQWQRQMSEMLSSIGIPSSTEFSGELELSEENIWRSKKSAVRIVRSKMPETFKKETLGQKTWEEKGKLKKVI